MQAHIQKWGNSLALRIPKAFAEETNLKQDSLVEVSLQDGRILVAPLAGKFTLSELLKEVTPENIHTETDTGTAVGKEVW
ncbi:MAG: AbrB/MazE/SpoVT family DNA-binding domain-containing protein [Candidatus Dadabacteria bacterium]|nr:AbrB/MazE/SpoVT family DNA-binding domain-containing protein [Candidatus Dadabacteria bacterium]